MARPDCLTIERLRSELHYDPKTGKFTRIGGKRTDLIGTEAGTPHSAGYISISVGCRPYLAHRLAWFYVYGEWPSAELDHKNRIRTDNRLSNLRDASRSQNMANTPALKNNKSGFRGVHWSAEKQRWASQIRRGAVRYSLGYFDTPEAASAAYAEAATKLFGSFAAAA